ncbi:MAG: hypothetical protein ACYDG6_14590 [Thermincolia bacterium]
MKIRAQRIGMQFDELGNPQIILTTNENRLQLQQEIAELKQVINKGKELSVEVKAYRHKRSLNANAYFWVLLSEMAAILHTTKDELYLIMLERYGVYTHLIVKLNVVERVKEEWRTVRELGEVVVNGTKGIQLQCYFGSSTYDTKEMSVLIDGVVQEAKELGIETMTPDELARIKSEWANEKEAS